MRHTRTWLFAFLPVFYVVIVLGLITVQFSKKSDSFSQSQGDLTLSGKTSNGGQPAEITLKGRGLIFLFDATHVLQVEDAAGATKLRPLSWRWKDGNVLVDFQEGVQLAFEKAGAALLVRPVANAALKRWSLVRIPFGPDSGSRLVPSRGTLMEITKNKVRTLGSVDGDRDRVDDRAFVLRSGANGFRPARIDPLPQGITPDLAWLTIGAGDPAAAEAALNQYWDRAYASWSSASKFSTPLVDAWSREALKRGDYPSAYAKIQRLLDQDRRVWGFDAVSYLGNVIELTAAQRREVETASSRAQPDWTGYGRLWLDAGYYGPEGSANRVKSLLVGGPLPDAVPALTAVLRNLLVVQSRQPSDAVTARIADVQRALQTRVIRRDGGLFVQSSEGLLDLRSSLVLGRLWLDYAKDFTSDSYGSAGAQLVASALAYQDAGRIPEVLAPQDGKPARQEGVILPEEIYASVHPAAPAEIPVPEWGSAFIRVSSSIVSKTITENQARFTFRFPAGAAEHVILAGVRPFDHITLHGIRWRTDPQFQSYTDGWYYSASTKTLYVKIKHREDLEELIVHFQPEE